jgi:nitroreductase
MALRSPASVDEAICLRRSVRGFLADEVQEDALRDALELAQRAPSSCNVQPWAPHIVSGQTLRRLKEALLAAGANDLPIRPDWPAELTYSGVYRERQVEAARKLYNAMKIERRDLVGRKNALLRNYAFFFAPHVMFIFLPEPFDTREATDVGMYAQTLMLALAARGIASCPQGALGHYPDIVRAHLAVPSSHKLLLGISFGYEDTSEAANASRADRAIIDQVVKFHR